MPAKAALAPAICAASRQHAKGDFVPRQSAAHAKADRIGLLADLPAQVAAQTVTAPVASDPVSLTAAAVQIEATVRRVRRVRAVQQGRIAPTARHVLLAARALTDLTEAADLTGEPGRIAPLALSGLTVLPSRGLGMRSAGLVRHVRTEAPRARIVVLRVIARLAVRVIARRVRSAPIVLRVRSIGQIAPRALLGPTGKVIARRGQLGSSRRKPAKAVLALDGSAAAISGRVNAVLTPASVLKVIARRVRAATSVVIENVRAASIVRVLRARAAHRGGAPVAPLVDLAEARRIVRRAAISKAGAQARTARVGIAAARDVRRGALAIVRVHDRRVLTAVLAPAAPDRGVVGHPPKEPRAGVQRHVLRVPHGRRMKHDRERSGPQTSRNRYRWTRRSRQEHSGRSSGAALRLAQP